MPHSKTKPKERCKAEPKEHRQTLARDQNAQLVVDWKKIADEICGLFARKQSDYGPRNIGDLGELAVFVRLYDKMQRLRRLVWEKGQEQSCAVKDETVDDTIVDIADYAIIWILLRRGLWPREGE